MTRSAVVSAAFLAVGMIGAAYLVSAARGQARMPPPTPTWPPRPDYIVNLRDRAVADNGDIVNVFDVPATKWLIVKDSRFAIEKDPTATGWGILQDPGWSNLELGETIGSTFATRIGESTNGVHFVADASCAVGSNPFANNYDHLPFQSVTGKVFRPGSHVQIRYSNPNYSGPKGSGCLVDVSWNLTGYFVDA
jgi:hypothetical protein